MIFRPAVPADLAAVAELLSENSLPRAGVRDSFDHFMVAEAHGVIVGAIGLEIFGRAALMRSAVVDSSHRNKGIGLELVNSILAQAIREGVQDLFLLTTGAAEYFTKLGFNPIGRDAVPIVVKASREFQGACPDSATVMQRQLQSDVNSWGPPRKTIR